jgi:hypothetical protein
MADQTDNVLLSDDVLGIPRTIDVGNDAIFLSTDMTLQAGGVIVADNLKRGTAQPEVGLVAGNEGDLYLRTAVSTGEAYVNTDGTATGWEILLTRPIHMVIDQLAHNIAETSYMELTRTSGQVTNVTYWTDSGKTTKIRETAITRTSGQVSQVQTIQYDEMGVAVETLTGSITRTGGRVSSIDWTFA